jgi:hypothetical protein
MSFVAAALTLLCCVASAAADTWYSVANPIDPAYLTEMPWGTRSDWIQQWRSYLYTPPATTLANGMGINFNVAPEQAAVTAQLLAASGIRRARLEISWSSVSYDNPTTFSNAAGLTEEIQALRQYGIRPLILLNANAQIPGPTKSFTANLTAGAPAGATTVQLDGATAAQVVPGYTGLDIGDQAAGVIFTSVDPQDVATLSRPLPSAFAAGSYPASTLRYQPFAQPQLADGSPNPQFEATLQGWLAYVRMTMNLVTDVYGSSNFDVEVWNELSFGSDFLDLGYYYNPLPAATQGNTDDALLAATVSFLKDPANGWSGVKVGDGFTNESGGDDVRTLPAGLDAIDKHPYSQMQVHPAQAEGTFPLDAFGVQDYTFVNNQPVSNYSPTYDAFLPEFDLTGINTETLTRQLAPMTTWIGSQPLGANVPTASGPPPAMWVTEDNLDPTRAQNVPANLTQSDYDHIHAKAALRYYVSFIGKGVQAVDLYAINGAPQWNLVSPGFFTAAQVGNSNVYRYPGAAAGGPVMAATGRLAATLAGAQTITTPDPLSLLGVANDSENYQFPGNGTAAYPPLYDRDVLMFQPFQLTENSWVAGVYVMSRDIATVYNPNLPDTDPTRTDMPPENFQITFGGVDAADLTATATDPLTGASVPVSIIARNGSVATIQLPVTDSPRMVTLTDPPPVAPAVAVLQTFTMTNGIGAAATRLSGGSARPDIKPQPGSGKTRAAGGSSTPLVATSSVGVVGRGIYLKLTCAVACRASWSLRTPSRADGGNTSGVSRLLPAKHSTTIRIATTSLSRPRGTVAITIRAPGHAAKIHQLRPLR